MTRLLVTVCPSCTTRFRITAAQVEVAGGRVRCGACLEIFEALPNVEQDAQAEDVVGVARPALQPAPRAAPPLSFTVVGADAVADEADTASVPVVADRPIRRRSVLDVEADTGALTPEERRRLQQLGVDTDVNPPPARRWRIAAPAAVAVVLLVAQYGYFRADSLASSVALRPWYEGVCRVLGCAVPVFHDASLLRSGSVVMRQHPERGDVLLIDAQILNEAPYPQPFPDVLVEILDRGGATLSSRVFTPMDYRRGELATIALVPPHRPLQLSLELLNPGGVGVNFRFELQPAGG